MTPRTQIIGSIVMAAFFYPPVLGYVLVLWLVVAVLTWFLRFINDEIDDTRM